MREQLISFEVAKLAKEKGFNEACQNYYQDSKRAGVFSVNKIDNQTIDELHKNDKYCVIYFSAPTQSLLQRWLREVHKICIDLNVSHYNYKENCCYFYGITMFGERIPTTNKCDKEKIFLRKGHFQSYEEALEIGLQEGLKLIK